MRRALRTLRAVSRLTALCVVTGALYAGWAVGAALTFVRGRVRVRWRGLVFRVWARTSAVLMGMRLGVTGEAPRPPFLLVPNHLSYVDVVALAASCECLFVAKKEVASWPVVGRLCRGAGAIFIDRQRRR